MSRSLENLGAFPGAQPEIPIKAITGIEKQKRSSIDKEKLDAPEISKEQVIATLRAEAERFFCGDVDEIKKESDKFFSYRTEGPYFLGEVRFRFGSLFVVDWVEGWEEQNDKNKKWKPLSYVQILGAGDPYRDYAAEISAGDFISLCNEFKEYDNEFDLSKIRMTQMISGATGYELPYDGVLRKILEN